MQTSIDIGNKVEAHKVRASVIKRQGTTIKFCGSIQIARTNEWVIVSTDERKSGLI